MILLSARFDYIIKIKKKIFFECETDISLTEKIDESEVELEEVANPKKKSSSVTKRLPKQSSNYSSDCIFS